MNNFTTDADNDAKNVLQVRMDQAKHHSWPNSKELSTTRKEEDWSICT